MPSLDEPSVPVQGVNLDCVVSEESVVSEAPSTEAGPSDILYVTSGDSLEQLVSSLISKMSELQSDRGRLPPVQSHSVVGSGSRPIVAATDYLGVSAPPQGVYLPNPVNPVFRLPTAPVSDETPPHRLFASDRKIQELEKDVSATRLAISSLCDRGFQPSQSLLDSASSLSRDLEDAKRSSSELRREIRPPSQPGVSSHPQRFAAATPVQPGPSHPEGDPASAGPSRRRPYDSPSGSFGYSSRQGSDTPPRKRRRLSDDSSADEGESSSSRRQRDDEQADEENFRPTSLALLLDYIMKKFPAASKPLVQPSSKRFHVFEAAGLVNESSQRSSNLAWFDHMRICPRRSLSRGFLRADRYPRFCPRSRGPRRCVTRLAKGRRSRLGFQAIGFQVCPVVWGGYGVGDDLAKYYGVLQLPVVDDDCPVSLSWRIGPF